MKSKLNSRSTSLLVLVASGRLLVGCGQAKSTPAATAPATAPSYLGISCANKNPVVEQEIDVQAMAPDCDGGACLRAQAVTGDASSGICTCRCDGPTGAGPFCTCGDGFVCREEVPDLGLSDTRIVGSYCVPN